MSIDHPTELKAFTHEPGSELILPFSTFILQIFPTRFFVHDESFIHPKEIGTITFDVQGPVKEFTVEQDLQKGKVRVWGKAQNGFFRYSLFYDRIEEKIVFLLEKSTISSFIQEVKGENFLFVEDKIYQQENVESPKLFFGCHKKQEIELIKRRNLFHEILPFWHRLTKITPQVKKEKSGSLFSYLSKLEKDIQEKRKENLEEKFLNYFKVGFHSFFCPTRKDLFYQGILESEQEEESPFFVFKKTSELLESLFFQKDKNTWEILPLLPSSLVSGRFLNYIQENIGKLDFEWRAKVISKMKFQAFQDQEILFSFGKKVKRFRLKEHKKEKGKKIEVGEPLFLPKGKTFYFDRFEK